MIDLLPAVLGMLALTVAADCYFVRRSERLTKQKLEEAEAQVRRFAEMVEAAKKKPAPTEELADFLSDLRTHGCGVVRIDPDNLLLRSPRERG
jgi:hypothetical protein